VYRPVISTMFINLDRLAPGELPSLKPPPSSALDGLLMWQFDDVTLWLRREQVGELVAKLAVHLPEMRITVSAESDEFLAKKKANRATLESVS